MGSRYPAIERDMVRSHCYKGYEAALSDKDDDLDMMAEKMVLVEQLERYY